ncbi:hypothetical protein SLEP1_g23623 [Rubroshorea leprosula]|uniref:ASCH domain-containing protein n=1 Tax=Rubroshorea leprosula TaxID=152421 RepID=A0AAV5JI77_9ROSI|nr:hypothetical protein SLEP1_g23623 [Rubroshorea leprosula]
MKGGGRAGKQGNYTNPCLTLHQPWASLLVHGIKRIEGRSWPAPIRGRLWIHAASKVPDEATIKAMEDFYREIYAVNGITDLKFPEHYPVSRLLGCVEVVGCLRCEELAQWEVLPEGVRLEGQTDFCWLCEQPQKLLIPFEMRGFQGVYNLEKKIYEAAVRGLVPVESPAPVKFPLPDPGDPFSLNPGSLSLHFSDSKGSEIEESSSLSMAIAGARAAATQFSRKSQNFQSNTIQNSRPVLRSQMRSKSAEENIITEANLTEEPVEENLAAPTVEQSKFINHEGSSSQRHQPHADLKQHAGAPSKIFAAALRGLKPS